MKHIFLLFILVLTACASKPQLYPNDVYKAKGKIAADADINLCQKEAEQFLESSAGKKIAKSAGFGAVVGGAMGAVSGILFGDIAGSAARGAALGGAGGAVSGALSPDEIKQRYVNKCLADKGYNVIGWD